ncbi:hypothetical protein CVT25_003294 [Psilocybe cyanescens]|uniref:Mid2 domain-containing protein n=1 Tax=Psilocybe cyanescens TaxID=93625 RepID=A0A409WMI1_PSICY|nr:hypothetical protein CVT25_003294 [Psilocybe cyanescens]
MSFLRFIAILLLIKGTLGSTINQTIDDLDPFILYQPPEKWQTYNDSSCSGGTYTIGHDSCVNATIQCSWVSFYYSSPLWPYPISTEISVDGNKPTVVDLQDHSAPSDSDAVSPSAGSRVVFSYLGTESRLHTILISGSTTNPYSVVDSLIFETMDGSGCGDGYGYHGGSTYTYSYSYGSTITDTVTATTTTTTKVDAPLTLFSTLTSTKTVAISTKTVTTTDFGATKSADTNIVTYYRHRNHGLKIGIAILAVIVGCLILCLCYLLWRRRQHGGYIPPGKKPTYGSGEPTTYGGGGGSGGGTSATGYGGGGSGGDTSATGYGGGGVESAEGTRP